MTTTPGTAGTAEGFDEAYRALAESGRYQTELPRIEAPQQPEPPAWLRWLIDLFSGTGDFWAALFWVIAAALALLLLFLVGRWLYRRHAERTRPDEDEEDAWRPEAGAARALLDAAEALAREGRYAEAAHLLLYRSLEDIERRLPDFLSPALTSRDIAGSDALPGPARGAFAAIATVVERGLFAARPVDETGWNEAREAYGRFAFGKNWA